ncbi:MAG: hypothetical protein H7A55_00645 [Verrucomicrobiaceae bacterium]|nr:hypothetical protein [Verrucomicrobiaceae bacterium]
MGKWPVLCLNDQTFYAYLSDYQVQDEEFASVGGVFLSKGYGHFAMPGGQLDRYYSVLAHELCHAQLATLQLPGWLDEAVTMIVEENLNGIPSYFLNREMIRRHRAYWSPAKLQDFWAGTTFWSPDDGQELSYHLSRFLFNALFQGGTVDPNNISHFILAAQRQDAGLTAAKEMLDIDLSEVVSSLLGEGDWSPDLEKISATKVQLEAPNAP